jgi:predicted component of type VI protein secretion system
VDEKNLTAEILWLCYQLDMCLHPLETREELLTLINTLVEKRDNLRKILYEKTTGTGNKTSS